MEVEAPQGHGGLKTLQPARSACPFSPFQPPAGVGAADSDAFRPLKEMTTRETATLLVEEFVEQHPEHFDERTGFVERVPLTRWLLSHRVPMPYRWRWRRKALGLVYDEEGRAYFVPSEKRRPLGDDE